MNLKEILSFWGLKEFTSILIKNGRYTACWNIVVNNRHFILKKIGTDSSHALSQVSVLNYLKNSSFSLSSPILETTINNEFFLIHESNFFILYSYITGNPINYSINISSYLLGSLVAEYHTIISSSNIVSNRQKKYFLISQNIDNAINNTSVVAKLNTPFFDLYYKLYRSFIDNYSMIDSKKIQIIDSLPKQVCHCDFYTNNVLVKDNAMVGIIDFSGISYEPKLFDFYNGLINCSSFLHKISLEKIKFYLKGYLKIQSLSDSEIELLPDLMIADLFFTLNWIFQEKVTDYNSVNDYEGLFRIYFLDYLIKNRGHFTETLFEISKNTRNNQ